MNKNISEVEKIFGYVFSDKVLCAEALQMAGPQAEVSIDGKSYSVAKNERLAILGDAVNDHVLCKMWYHSEGFTGKTFLDC